MKLQASQTTVILMLAALACVEPEPRLFVLIEDPEADCYRPCEPVPERVAEVLAVCPDPDYDACDAQAKLGANRVALALDYGDTVRFDSVGTTLTRPSVAAVIDGNQTVALGTLANVAGFDATGTNGALALAHDDFELPLGPGGEFEFTVTSGDLELRSGPVRFAGPDRPRLQTLGRAPSDDELAALDFAAPSEPIRLAHGEPCEACRSLWIAVDWPRFADADAVTLTTSYGSFDDGTKQGVDTLDLSSTTVDGRAAVELRIPELPTSDQPNREVVIRASVGSLRASLSIPILTPPPSSASLVAPASVVLGDNGSPQVVLAGIVTMPEGASLIADSLSLIVDAVADPDVVPNCTALPDTFLRCDPDNVDAAIDGGCILTPSGVSVLGETSFSITLAGGICFAGTVSIQLAALDYDATPIDDCGVSPCLAEGIGDTRVELLGEGVDIVFAPP